MQEFTKITDHGAQVWNSSKWNKKEADILELENRAEVLEVPYSLCNYKWVLSFHHIK